MPAVVVMEDGDVSFMLSHDIATFVELQNLNRKLESLVRNFNRGRATEEEFLHYIHTEMRLMDDCKRIINVDLTNHSNDVNDSNVAYDNTRILAEFSKNIFNMFNIMFNTFTIRSSSLKQYIDFCLDNNVLFIKCKDFLSNITLTYQSDPEVYITVAMFMYEECSDIQEARRHFIAGTIHHRNYKRLHIEYFSMEIQHLEKTGGATFEFVLENYNNIKQLYKGQIDFHFMLLDKTMRMTRVMNILGVIVEDMIIEYKHSSFMWQKLVQMNEKGFIFDHSSKFMSYSYCGYCNIENCIFTYELGLKSISICSEKLDLWEMYLDHLKMFKESYHMQSVQISNLINSTIMQAFHVAHENRAIRSIQYYIYWASLHGNTDIILNSQDLIYEQLKFGIKIINHYITACNFSEFFNVAFIICFPSLKNNTFSLWHLIRTYMKSNNLCLLELLLNQKSYADGEGIENRCFKLFRKNFSSLKIAASTLYEVFRTHPKKCIVLFNCLLIYIRTVARFKIANVRLLASKFCKMSGKRNIDLWIDYIRFEYTFVNHNKVKRIFKASLAYLDDDLHETMKNEYNKLVDEFENCIIEID